MRTQDGLLGRERLARIFTRAGSPATATSLLQTVRHEAHAIRDDMAACVLKATAGAPGSEHVVEELELDAAGLDAGQGDRFLAACGVTREQAAVTLTRARSVADQVGATVLRAELTGRSAHATAYASAPIVLEPGADLSVRRHVAGPTRSRMPATAPRPASA